MAQNNTRNILVRDLKPGDVVEVTTTYRIVEINNQAITTIGDRSKDDLFFITANFEDRPFDPFGKGTAKGDSKIKLVSREPVYTWGKFRDYIKSWFSKVRT